MLTSTVTAFGGAIGLENPSRKLRDQVAEYILNHLDKYNEAILGDDPLRYISRMRQMDTWGGAIELSILSDIYNLEISSIDVKACFSPIPAPHERTNLTLSQTLRIDRFGENKDSRVIIVYSGIHYDRIAFTMDLSYPVEVDETRWSTSDDEVLQKALQLAKRLQNMHYYTDTTDFVLKCEQCNWIGQGQREATKHQKETGHVRFGELQIT
jgi:ubiquitin thioesterase OTU1